jgi:hypothetical protein
MFGILFLYFIGKAYYKLAGEHFKSQWPYAILGVVIFYAGTFFAGIFFAILSLIGIMDIENWSDRSLGLLSIPIGLLFCWGGYKLLERNWSKTAHFEDPDSNILDESELN